MDVQVGVDEWMCKWGWVGGCRCATLCTSWVGRSPTTPSCRHAPLFCHAPLLLPVLAHAHGFEALSDSLLCMLVLPALGGTAYLSLENEDAPYLHGIKYTAMPPTKRFRDMEQLSGEQRGG